MCSLDVILCYLWMSGRLSMLGIDFHRQRFRQSTYGLVNVAMFWAHMCLIPCNAFAIMKIVSSSDQFHRIEFAVAAIVLLVVHTIRLWYNSYNTKQGMRFWYCFDGWCCWFLWIIMASLFQVYSSQDELLYFVIGANTLMIAARIVYFRKQVYRHTASSYTEIDQWPGFGSNNVEMLTAEEEQKVSEQRRQQARLYQEGARREDYGRWEQEGIELGGVTSDVAINVHDDISESSDCNVWLTTVCLCIAALFASVCLLEYITNIENTPTP